MYELIQVSAHDYYINCPAKIGLVEVGEGRVIAIDSGSDKDAGKKVLRILQEKNWLLAGIYNTHSHADHIGGNKYLQEQTGCPVFAPGIECDFTNHPLLEPSLLYGGYPLADLRHKFLMAQESRAQPLSEQALPGGIRVIPLPGHSFDMVGFRTPDDVVYLADCLSSAQTLDKYGVGYLLDVEAYLSTLEQVKTMSAKCFVPSHAEVCEDIAPLAQYNIDAVHGIGETILSFCTQPAGFDFLLQQLFTAYRMTMSLQQYALVGSTLRSYLAWLKNKGRITCFFDDNRLLWQST